MAEKIDSKKVYVRMSVGTGVSPLELRFTQVNDSESKLPIAYRATAVVNSMMMGTLTEEHYESAMAVSPVGSKLAEWGIRETVRFIGELEKAEIPFRWVSFKCPSAVTVRADLFEIIKKLIDSGELEHPEHLCLEFQNTLLLENPEKARTAMLDMQLLKVKTLMSGCASDNCPVQTLNEIPVDMVILDPSVTALAVKKGREGVVPALISYLKAMGVDPIASEIMDDTQVQEFHRLEVYGYVPSEFYVGKGSHGPREMREEDVMEQEH